MLFRPAKFQSRNDKIIENRRNIREEIAFQLLGIATNHFICCAFLLQDARFDTDLLTVKRNEIPTIFCGILFLLSFI